MKKSTSYGGDHMLRAWPSLQQPSSSKRLKCMQSKFASDCNAKRSHSHILPPHVHEKLGRGMCSCTSQKPQSPLRRQRAKVWGATMALAPIPRFHVQSNTNGLAHNKATTDQSQAANLGSKNTRSWEPAAGIQYIGGVKLCHQG